MIVIFDLELTAWPGSVQRNWTGPGEFAEIIQIGAVRLDDEMCEIGALDLAIKPRLNPILSDYIVGLTGLTQERVDRDGVSLEAGLARLARFAEGSRALLCNGGDAEWIRYNVGLAKIDNPLDGMRFASSSHHFRQAAGRADHIVSSTLPATFGFDVAGRAHDGLADARAISEALRRTMPCGGISALLASLTDVGGRHA